jgi:hypothetical protein
MSIFEALYINVNVSYRLLQLLLIVALILSHVRVLVQFRKIHVIAHVRLILAFTVKPYYNVKTRQSIQIFYNGSKSTERSRKIQQQRSQ